MVERNVPIRLADGRKTTGQIVRIASMKVGAFDLKTSKVQGVKLQCGHAW